MKKLFKDQLFFSILIMVVYGAVYFLTGIIEVASITSLVVLGGVLVKRKPTLEELPPALVALYVELLTLTLILGEKYLHLELLNLLFILLWIGSILSAILSLSISLKAADKLKIRKLTSFLMILFQIVFLSIGFYEINYLLK